VAMTIPSFVIGVRRLFMQRILKYCPIPLGTQCLP
jgi:hypothetical protein